MILSYCKKAVVLLFPLVAYAGPVPTWQIVPNESTLVFTGIQNNAPVSGKFTHFTGDIKFDPTALANSSVKIVVDIDSITASYKDLVDTLKTKDWFDVKSFPQAVFVSKQFQMTGGNTYQVTGTLTVRDKTQPLTLNFQVTESSNNKAKVTGSTTIKRTAFGVGQGEWSGTNEVKDDVKVNFSLSVIKK